MTRWEFRSSNGDGGGLAARLMGAAVLVAALGCGSQGSTPPANPDFRDASVHKVQVSAEKAALLEKQGSKVIADYGSYKLLQTQGAALAEVASQPGVELRDDYNEILLNAGPINTASAQGQSLRGMTLPTTGKRFHLVQFAGAIQPEWVKGLEATGLKIVTYIPNNAYLVYGDAQSLSRLQNHISASGAIIQWNGDYLDDYKLDPSIQAQKVEGAGYTIQLIKDDESNPETLSLIRTLQQRDGSLQEALGYVNVVATLSRDALYQIAKRTDVVSIQPRPEMRKFDERQDRIISGQLTGNVPSGPGHLAWLASKGFTQAQFTASGFGVDVSDSGIDNGTQTPNHFGLYVGGDVTGQSRVVYNRLEGTANAGSTLQGCDGHGNLNTHIVGGFATATGAPFSDTAGYAYGLGVAPFVKVGSSVVFDPGSFTSPNYENLQSRAYRDGMRISTNSWGSSANTYTTDAQRYDALVRDAQPATAAVPAAGNQEMVILFAAGNGGSGANTVGSPSTGKNVFTIGASENVQAFGGADACGELDTDANSAYDMATFSSRGPTSDGRKKPDITAPGTHVSGGVGQTDPQRASPPAVAAGQALSCFDASGVCAGPGGSKFFPTTQQWYTASSGTSHSTPALAGATALLRQYFINQSITPPSPAMTKAYLMNSARYMTGLGANDSLYSNTQGMGLLDLSRAFDGIPRLLDDENPANLLTASGQTRTFSGVVSDSTQPFRVTLAWTDAPGSTTGSAFKNNLDLTVTVAGNTYKGNVFTGANSVTGGTADAANNVESVFVPAGVEGAYTVTVTATNINSDGVPGNASAIDQDFALISYNSCATAPAVPAGVTAAVNGNNRIDISFTPNGSPNYNIYRSLTAGGPYTRVGTTATSPYSDTTVSGGAKYYYVVRAVNCAESAKSAEVSTTATGTCTIPPTFAGLTAAANGGVSTCTNTLTWAAATPVCSGTITYSVYRGSVSGFTPSAANKIASNVSGTTYSDTANLSQGQAAYYVVRATEVSSGTNEDTNAVEKSAAPTGTVTPGVRYFDDLDGNRPANASSYWIPTITGTAGTVNIVSGCHYQSATKAYRFGAAATTCGGTYPTSTAATLSLGGNGTIPAINGFAIPAVPYNPSLTFNLWYAMESTWDGAWLAYSTTGAAGPWTYIADTASTTAPYIMSGGYDIAPSSSTGTATGVPKFWSGSAAGANQGANGSLKAVTVNLSALAGQTVWFGFRYYADNTINFEGTYLDDVRIVADSAATCTTNVPPPGPAVALKVNGLAATAQAGVATTFTVSAVDAVGITATSYNGTINFTSTDAQATFPASVTLTNGVSGPITATFGTLGSQTVTAKDSVTPTISGSGSTTVGAGPATKLYFASQPSNTVAGVSITAFTVGLKDAFGNPVTTGTNSVTVALANNPGGGTLTGTATVNMVGGVATFGGLSLSKAAIGYTLSATATGLTSATSSAFNITPAAASKLAFLVSPASTAAGATLTPAVQVSILDTFGNATTSTANVTLTLSTNPGTSTLTGTTTVAAVNGVASFGNLSLDKLGTGYKLTATSGTLTSAVSGAFDIVPGAPFRVAFTGQPSNVVSGAVFSPTVQASILDRFGNVVSLASNPVTLSLGNNPTGATISGSLTVTPVSGVATFTNVALDRAGSNYTLVAGSSGLYTDTSVGFNVGVGAPAKLAVVSLPATATAGTQFSVSVAVQDAGGNTITTGAIAVQLSLTGAPGATLSGTTTATSTNGVATFTNLSVDKAGSGYTLQAAAPGLASGTSAPFQVVAGPAFALGFTVQPTTAAAGVSLGGVQVSIQDAFGNAVTSATPAVTLSLVGGPARAKLSGTTSTNAINGVVTFSNLSVNKVATGYTLSASSGSLSGTSASFDVTRAPKSQLVFASGATNTQAHSTFGAVNVEIQDAYGNVDTSATDQVTLTLGGASGGSLGGTISVAAVNGVATFPDLFIDHAAAGYTLTADAAGVTSATGDAFAIAPGPTAVLVFAAQPGNLAAGPFGTAVKIELQDAYGNRATDATDTVTLALGTNTAGGTLGGTTSVKAISGVASFDTLALTRAGTGYTLTAAAASLTNATSSAFNVTAGPAANLVFKSNPSNTTAGTAFGPVSVEIRDAYGNTVTGTNSITVSLQGGQGASLGGTTTVTAANGVATFADLAITRAASGYKLTAQATGLSNGNSSAFDVAPGAAAALAFAAQPGAVQAGAAVGPLLISIVDAYGNTVTSATDSIAVALGSNPGNGSLTGTTTVAAVKGVATFPDLSLNRAAKGYTLSASAGTLSLTSSTFDVTAGPPSKLVFRGTPAKGTAGTNLAALTVELQDALGNVLTDSSANVTISLGINPAAAQLLGSPTVTAKNGVATFDTLKLLKAGTGFQLVATAQGFASGTSEAFEVTAGTAANYIVSLNPSVTAGQEVPFTATAYDAYGNVATGYAGSVKLTSTDGAVVLPATAKFTAGVLSGKATFKSSGLRTLTLTDSEKATLTGLAQTNVTPFPQPTVAVTDPAGGTTVSGKVTITASGAAAAGTTLSQISILVDGVVIATGSDATLTGEYDSTKAQNGSNHSITAVVLDAAGNVATSVPVGFSVRNGGCGCGAASGSDASVYVLLLAAGWYLLGRRRKAA